MSAILHNKRHKASRLTHYAMKDKTKQKRRLADMLDWSLRKQWDRLNQEPTRIYIKKP